MKNKIVIFAGSRMPIIEEDILNISNFAKKIAYENYDIIYGGGNLGVMGLVAKECQKFGSHVTSVVVEKYAHEEQLNDAKIILAKNDFDRFSIMMTQENVVASMVFPGGPGTIREAFSALELAIYEKGNPVLLPSGFQITEKVKSIFDCSVKENYINSNFHTKMPLITLEDKIEYFLENNNQKKLKP